MLASRLPEHEHRNRFARRDRPVLQAARAASTSAACASASRRPWTVVGVLAVLIGVGVVTFRSVPAEFTPQADNGRAFIAIEGPEGSSFEYMDGYARQLEAIALKDDGARRHRSACSCACRARAATTCAPAT